MNEEEIFIHAMAKPGFRVVQNEKAFMDQNVSETGLR
jgi:hypothetical protein